MLAYLVIREGAKWTDVFRLVPGQAVTIGRAPTNQIILKDDRCSRCHAEIFMSDGAWTLRDLESRNGTAVGERMISEDHGLSPGDVIRIGRSQMAFVHDLSAAFGESSSIFSEPVSSVSEGSSHATSDSSVLTISLPATITHRRGQTKFLEPDDAQQEDGEEGEKSGKAGRAAAMLCRLAIELAKAPDTVVVAKTALAGLFDGTRVDSGAVLLLPNSAKGTSAAAQLEVVATRTDTERPYQRVSPFLATTVIREGEALLARNVMDDSTLGNRDSKGEIHATSIICAPIRRGKKVFGLVHLYSTDAESSADPDDLEFTLAVADTLAVVLQNLSRRQELADNLNQFRDENQQLRERLGAQSEIVGRSPAMAKISEETARAAPSKATVLIRGESGVGKELVARAVHFSSPRRKAAFVCLNCAALSESLLESELFGHERGAFTGATDRKIGKFEAADKGTLMLDEIGEMSPTIQAKFLRVLEGHPFERVGGSEPLQVDVRVIAATNRNLERDVAKGLFRRDLYFRLHVLQIDVPPLRKRPEDIPELASYFLQKFNQDVGRRIRGFTHRAMDELMRYRWPGNVRELKNVIERAGILLDQGDRIDLGDLMLSNLATAGDTAEASSDHHSYQPLSLADLERRHILATLRANHWNKSKSAGILGIERSTLDRKIRRYELTDEIPRRA